MSPPSALDGWWQPAGSILFHTSPSYWCKMLLDWDCLVFSDIAPPIHGSSGIVCRHFSKVNFLWILWLHSLSRFWYCLANHFWYHFTYEPLTTCRKATFIIDTLYTYIKKAGKAWCWILQSFAMCTLSCWIASLLKNNCALYVPIWLIQLFSWFDNKLCSHNTFVPCVF